MTPINRSDRTLLLFVGAGLSNVATAVRVLRGAQGPLDVMLLERVPEWRCAGIAYARSSARWEHIFNIQAGRMSAFREDTNDFLRWANEEANRADWPDEWREHTFIVSGPAPRILFHGYLEDRLAQAAAEAAPGVRLLQPQGDAVDLEDMGEHALVHVRGYRFQGEPPQDVVLRANHVVLGTGVVRRNQEDVLWPAKAHPRFILHQYSARANRQLNNTDPDGNIVIVGCFLSAYDAVVSLLKRGHRGPITMLSRSGLMPQTYPRDHTHAVIKMPRPEVLDKPFTTAEQLEQDLAEAYTTALAQVAADHPHIPAKVRSERLLKAWEPWIPELMAKLPPQVNASLLSRHASVLAQKRVCAMPSAVEPIMEAMEPGPNGEQPQVQLVLCHIHSIEACGPEEIEINIIRTDGVEKSLKAGLCIANMGLEHDYGRIRHELWRNLIDKRELARRHPPTGLGVDVGEHGRLVHANGDTSQCVSVVGLPRVGDEIARNGRLGAFAFNLASIKNQSIDTAMDVVDRLELGAPTPLPQDLTQAVDQISMATIEELAQHTIQMFSFPDRARREQMGQALEGALDALQTQVSAELGEDAAQQIRGAVSRRAREAARIRLTDVTITPKELGERLGTLGSAGIG